MGMVNIPPIKMVIWGMVYSCVDHVTHGQLIDVCEYVDGLWKVTPPGSPVQPKGAISCSRSPGLYAPAKSGPSDVVGLTFVRILTTVMIVLHHHIYICTCIYLFIYFIHIYIMYILYISLYIYNIIYIYI